MLPRSWVACQDRGRLVIVRQAVAIASAVPAKAATATIPIVFLTGSDPVALGLVASLNRPGANLTGIANLEAELAPKRLQLLRELIPDAALFGILADPAFPATQSIIADLQAAARTLGLQLVVTSAAESNSRRWRSAMRCPRSSRIVSSPWPAA